MGRAPAEPAYARALAFKAWEIEEYYDRWVSRPVGALAARAGRAMGASPNQMTVLATLVGVAGGTLQYDTRTAAAGFLLLIAHGILDSADGQLARWTGQSSDLGRVLDGASGYVTHVVMYAAIAAGFVARGGTPAIWVAAAAAGASTIAHAQLYDYHRGAYIDAVLKGKATKTAGVKAVRSKTAAAKGRLALADRILRGYEAVQRRLVGPHLQVEAALASRAPDGELAEADRDAYRRAFYRRVCGWNLFGDNTRRFALGACALLMHPEWYFAFVLFVANAALVMVWRWQASADRAFLRALASPAPDRAGR